MPKHAIGHLRRQGFCSYFVLMTSTIDTLGKAVRHNMLVMSECSCGNVRYYRAYDLMMAFGGGRSPFGLPFTCTRCKPRIKVKVFEPDPDHLPKQLIVHKPMKGPDGKVAWVAERFRGP